MSKDALLRSLERRYIAEGQLILPAVPALLDHYAEMLRATFANLARPMSEKDFAELRALLASKLEDAYAAAPQSNVFVRYKLERLPGSALSYAVASAKSSLPEEYDHWVSTRVGWLFGTHHDAKVMNVARALGSPGEQRVLDVGAGTGRNTLPLARAGFRTVALELAPALADVLADELAKESLDVQVACGDVFDDTLAVPHAPFDLCVVAEVVPHLRGTGELRRLLVRLGGLVRPGGTLLLSAFLTKEGYAPDDTARQIAQVLWSSFFTPAEMAEAAAGLPWKLVSNESVLAYERAHLPAHAWPPTSWYVSWASGSDTFDLPPGGAPIELRWLVYRRLTEPGVLTTSNDSAALTAIPRGG